MSYQFSYPVLASQFSVPFDQTEQCREIHEVKEHFNTKTLLTEVTFMFIFQPENLLIPTDETDDFPELAEPLTPVSPRFPPHALMNLSPSHVTSPST